MFERMTFADTLIAADTVANQQIALDALTGNSYQDLNCAIRILQATDATDYRLFVDNINFIADDNLEDISIQFVGTGILTLENTNGTVLKYVSAPVEVEQVGTTLVGGGSIVEVDNVIRYKSNDTITNSFADKLVTDGAGTTYTISGGGITEVENVSGNAVAVNLEDGAPIPTLTETNGSITLSQDVTIMDSGLIDGSRVQLWNVTKGAELDNSLVSGGGGYSFTVNLLGGTVDNGDTLRLRATYQSGVTAKLGAEALGIVTPSGLSFSLTQEDDTIYNTIGLDGSTITKFTADYLDDEVDIVTASDFLGTELYARFIYFETTEEGIRNFYGGFEAVDIANYKNDVSVLDLYLNNNTATNLKQTDNVRLYKSNEVYPVRNPTTGGGGIDIVWRNQIYFVNDSEITAIKAQTDKLTFNGSNEIIAADSATIVTDIAAVQATVDTIETKVDAVPTAAENALELLDNQNTV